MVATDIVRHIIARKYPHDPFVGAEFNMHAEQASNMQHLCSIRGLYKSV